MQRIAYWRRLIEDAATQKDSLELLLSEKALEQIIMLPSVFSTKEELENYIVAEHLLPDDYESTIFGAIINEKDLYIWGLEEITTKTRISSDHMTWDITRRFPLVDERPIYDWDFYIYEEDYEIGEE